MNRQGGREGREGKAVEAVVESTKIWWIQSGLTWPAKAPLRAGAVERARRCPGRRGPSLLPPVRAVAPSLTPVRPRKEGLTGIKDSAVARAGPSASR